MQFDQGCDRAPARRRRNHGGDHFPSCDRSRSHARQREYPCRGSRTEESLPAREPGGPREAGVEQLVRLRRQQLQPRPGSGGLMRVYLEGVGLVGPGLSGWEPTRALLAGNVRYQPGPTAVAASELLPATERRRAGMPVKLALAAGHEALAAAARDAAKTATVFSSSSGDCDNVHHMLEALSTPERQISP